MNREEKKLETRRRIIDTAMRLFAEQGYEATTVAQITEAAGVSKGTFFNYFDNKEVVLVSCDLLRRSFLDEMHDLETKPGPMATRMMSLLMGLISQLNHTRSLAKSLFQAYLYSPRALDYMMEQMKELREIIAPLFAAGQERGEFKKTMPPELLADLAMQTYNGVLLHWCLGSGEEDLTTQMLFSFEVFLKGVCEE